MADYRLMMNSKECKKLENGKISSKIVNSALEAKSCADYPKKLSRKSTSIKVVPSIPVDREGLNWCGWGYSDSRFALQDGIIRFTGDRYPISGLELPHLCEYIKDKYNVQLEQTHENISPKIPDEKFLPKSIFNENTIKEIENLGIAVSIVGVIRYIRSGGQTYEEIIKLRKNKMSRIPDAVAWPTCHEDVEKIVELADLHNFVIIPFGGGTSVTKAIECPECETRPILSLDMNKMNEILWVDMNNMTMCAESGIRGQDLERELNEIGYTVGHEPDSIEFSTLGGWVSTRASGMKKNLYGNIEDLMIHARLVTPKGVMERNSKSPRISCGPDFNHVILGSEGNLGVITEVVLKIRPLPECQLFESIVFPDFKTGIAFMREIALRRWQPASIRLMDEEQFQIGWSLRPRASYFSTLIEWMKFKYLENIKGFQFNKICLCTISHEGTKLEVSEHIKKIMKLAVEMGGVQSGETTGKRGYMMTFVVAYMRDIAIEFNVVAESMETAMPWDTVYEASRKIREAVTNEGIKLGVNKSLCMMRIAQTYDSGCCLYVYFSFSISPDKDGIEICDEINNKIKALCFKFGGSISHHHGVGKLKRKFYPKFVSEPAVNALKGIKQQLDPKNIFGVRNILENYSDEDSMVKAKL